MTSKHKEFMESPDKWPRWPRLPLVNRKTGKSGFLVEGATSVFLANIWDEVKSLHDLESEKFDTFDDVVNAGWEVD